MLNTVSLSRRVFQSFVAIPDVDVPDVHFEYMYICWASLSVKFWALFQDFEDVEVLVGPPFVAGEVEAPCKKHF